MNAAMIFDYDTIRYAIFPHWLTLALGKWPNPVNVEAQGSSPGVNYHALFESPCIVAAEIHTRVRAAGQDGMLVEHVFGMECPALGVDGVSDRYHIHVFNVEKVINGVAWYCSDADWNMGLPYRKWREVTHGNRKYRNFN